MKLRERIDIAATAEAVWPFVADPVLQSVWNPRIVAVDREAEGPVRRGERFAMVYRMGSVEREASVEVTECDPPNGVVFAHTSERDGRRFRSAVGFSVEPRGERARVTQTIDLAGSGIARSVMLLISLVHRLGRSVGEPYLAHLKRVVESPNDEGP